MAGVVIVTAWVLAARDKSYGGASGRCNGCVQLIHEQIKEHPEGIDNPLDDNPPKTWLRFFRDPYPILIAFGSILCAAWLLTGFIGLTSNNSSGYRLVFNKYKNSTLCFQELVL